MSAAQRRSGWGPELARHIESVDDFYPAHTCGGQGTPAWYDQTGRDYTARATRSLEESRDFLEWRKRSASGFYRRLPSLAQAAGFALLLSLAWWSLSATTVRQRPTIEQAAHEAAPIEERAIKSAAELWQEAGAAETADDALSEAVQVPEPAELQAAQDPTRLETELIGADVVSFSRAPPAATPREEALPQVPPAASEQMTPRHIDENLSDVKSSPTDPPSGQPPGPLGHPEFVTLAERLQHWEVTPLQALLAAIMAIGLPIIAMARKKRPAKLQAGIPPQDRRYVIRAQAAALAPASEQAVEAKIAELGKAAVQYSTRPATTAPATQQPTSHAAGELDTEKVSPAAQPTAPATPHATSNSPQDHASDKAAQASPPVGVEAKAGKQAAGPLPTPSCDSDESRISPGVHRIEDWSDIDAQSIEPMEQLSPTQDTTLVLPEGGQELHTPQQAVVMLQGQLMTARRRTHEVEAHAKDLSDYNSDLEGVLLTKESEYQELENDLDRVSNLAEQRRQRNVQLEHAAIESSEALTLKQQMIKELERRLAAQDPLLVSLRAGDATQVHTPLEEALMERAQQTAALRTENVMLRAKVSNIEARSTPPSQDPSAELQSARKDIKEMATLIGGLEEEKEQLVKENLHLRHIAELEIAGNRRLQQMLGIASHQASSLLLTHNAASPALSTPSSPAASGATIDDNPTDAAADVRSELDDDAGSAVALEGLANVGTADCMRALEDHRDTLARPVAQQA